MSLLGTINILSFVLLLGSKVFLFAGREQIFIQVAVVGLLIWAWPRMNKVRTSLVVQGVFLGLALVASPRLNNSETASSFVALLVLVLLWPLFRQPSVATGRSIRARLNSSLMVGFLILYGWAVIHKLNFDFLNTQSSCAVQIFRNFPFIEANGFMGRSYWVRWIVISITFLFEAGLPLIIVFQPRLRLLCLCLLWSFHFILSPSFFGFLPTVLIFSAPFLSSRHRLRFVYRIRHLSIWAIAGLAVLFLAARYSVWVRQVFYWPSEMVMLAQAALAFVLIGLLLWPLLQASRQNIVFKNVLWWWVILFLANGFTPYLGVKTVGAWAMYSNLRTEGANNHLFLPSVDLFQLRDDLIPVPADLRMLVTNGSSFFLNVRGDLQAPRFEVGRWLSQKSNSGALDVRNGLTKYLGAEEVKKIEEFYLDSPWWYKKVFAFRPLSTKPGACMW